MKITTLGTSHGDSTYCRFNTSTLYELNGALYLVDCGEPCEALMCRKGKDFSKLRAVFITHMHDDHAGGLTELVKTLIKYAKPGQHTTVYFPEEGAKEAFHGWTRALHMKDGEEYISYGVVKPGEVYRDENIAVSAYATDHIPSNPVKPCTFAFILDAEGKHILHTGDLWVDFHDFPKIAAEEEFDACLCEATHYKTETALPLFAASKIRRMIFMHIANRFHGETGELALLSLAAKLDFPVEVAHDGDEFIL